MVRKVLTLEAGSFRGYVEQAAMIVASSRVTYLGKAGIASKIKAGQSLDVRVNQNLAFLNQLGNTFLLIST